MHGGVDAEAARAPPGEHAGGVELVEESAAAEVAKDASLEDGFELAYVIGGQLGGLVKLDLAAAGLAEHPVGDGEVVVRVDVERSPGRAGPPARRPRTRAATAIDSALRGAPIGL